MPPAFACTVTLPLLALRLDEARSTPFAPVMLMLPFADVMVDEGRLTPAAAVRDTSPSFDGPRAVMLGEPTPVAAMMAPSAMKLTEPPLLFTVPIAMSALAVSDPPNRVVVTEMSPPVERSVKAIDPSWLMNTPAVAPTVVPDRDPIWV